MSAKHVLREDIIIKVIEALEQHDFVLAAWEGGAAAFNRIDAWSDIDLVVAVKDDKVEDAIKLTEETLDALASIERKIRIPQPTWHGHDQAIYRLKNASKYLIIDYTVMKESNPNKLLEREIHGNVLVHFDKKNIINPVPVNREQFSGKLADRLEELKNWFTMFQYLIEKELNRGNYIEAFGYYYRFTLDILVEVLRIKYNPFHYNFKTRYLYYDLPDDIVTKLETLYFVDKNELADKHQIAKEWFTELTDNIDTKIQ